MKILAALAWLTATGSVGVIAAADAITESIGGHTPLVEMTALSSLVAALFFLLKVYVPAKDRQFIEALDKKDERHERWEKERHEDSRELRETLGSMRDNCIATQTHLRSEKD